MWDLPRRWRHPYSQCHWVWSNLTEATIFSFDLSIFRFQGELHSQWPSSELALLGPLWGSIRLQEKIRRWDPSIFVWIFFSVRLFNLIIVQLIVRSDGWVTRTVAGRQIHVSIGWVLKLQPCKKSFGSKMINHLFPFPPKQLVWYLKMLPYSSSIFILNIKQVVGQYNLSRVQSRS